MNHEGMDRKSGNFANLGKVEGREIKSSTPASLSKAEAVARQIMELQRAHEDELAEATNRTRELEKEVQALTARSEALEADLLFVKAQNREMLQKQQEGVGSASQAKSLAPSPPVSQPAAKAEPPAQDNVKDTDKNKVDLSLLGSESLFIAEKSQFINFVKGVAKGTESPEYQRMYHFLLKCFTEADNNFDGRVGFQEFETLIEIAAFLPRRYGFAPSTPEMYATDFDRVKQRLKLFNSLHPSRAAALNKQAGTYDYISFATWLKYAISHITEKAALLESEALHCQMLGSRDEFQEFIIAACSSRRSRQYKELYHFLLKCFTEADKDFDGLIDNDDFAVLVDIAAQAPRMFGFAPPVSETYKTQEEMNEARAAIFRNLDKKSIGYINFDTWLEYIYTHICEKTSQLGSHGTVPDIEAAGHAGSAPRCPWRV